MNVHKAAMRIFDRSRGRSSRRVQDGENPIMPGLER